VDTIEVGVPGTGGDIATGEGAVWLSIRTMPVIRIDPASDKVTAQLVGAGGDAMRVGHGYVWLSNGRQHTVWRFLPEKVVAAAPHPWTDDARSFDLDGDGKADVLVEDLTMFIPGQPASFHMKVLNPKIGSSFVLTTNLNGKKAETPFLVEGGQLTATLGYTEPRWIHYSVCLAKSPTCAPELVVASPTTTNDYATNKVRFVPDTFMAPPAPLLKGYRWNILEPEILKQDYAALATLGGHSGPLKTTMDEDYGEVKRHRWEFQHLTSFAYGVLTEDGSEEVACVYVNPSKKAGFDATVRVVFTSRGEKLDLASSLPAEVKDWIKSSFPFTKVAFPGIDMPMTDWNKLPDVE
jgi:hypothetical protein